MLIIRQKQRCVEPRAAEERGEVLRERRVHAQGEAARVRGAEALGTRVNTGGVMEVARGYAR